MPRSVLTIVAILASACGPAAAPRAPVERDVVISERDTLPLRYRPANGVLSLNIGRLRQLAITSPFTYVGGQRFILRRSADAEQHLFVVADAARVVQRLYWVQIEELLPSESEPYDYSADSLVTVDGFTLPANFRTYTTPADAGSDRAWAFDYVTAQGYTIPPGGTRVRLVYLPEHPARREVMIIYFESSPAAASDPHAAFLTRATTNLTLGF